MTQMPTPPPPGASRRTIDFARPFTYVFEDPNWLPKVAIGGLMTLLAILLIGIPFILGYCARLARNVAAGKPQPLPEWDAWGEDFGEGLKLAVIGILWYLPIILIAIVGFGGSAMVGAMAGDTSEAGAMAASGMFGFAMCLFYALVLVIAVLLPAALTLAVMRQDFGSAFAFGQIFAFIRENLANYVLSILVYLVAGFLSQFGVILLCIGVIFTNFWSQLVSTHAFAETYRYSPVK